MYLNMVAIRLPVKNELNRFSDWAISKTEFEKYNIPYEKNMFKTTTARVVFRTSGEKTSMTSSLIEKISVFSLKIK